MTTMNGAVDLDELARLAQEASSSMVVREPLQPSTQPFNQQAHELMIKGIDQVASDWVSELEHVRDNSKKVEALVLERAAKVKSDITALYLLGNAALAEAKRGDEVNARLGNELDRLSEYQE